MSTLTVAIVTARLDHEVHYAPWGRKVLEIHRDGAAPWVSAVGPQWLALVTALDYFRDAAWHVEYQLRALALQSRPPTEVLVVDRCYCEVPSSAGYPFVDGRCEPMLSLRELKKHPELWVDSASSRDRLTPYGCADKNTAIALCTTDHLVMLDDACLPTFGCLETVWSLCDEGKIVGLRHRKLTLDSEVFVSDGNTGPRGHQRWGIWAMPHKYALALNGYNTILDGTREAWDVEFKHRLDQYARMRGLEYAYPARAMVYEVDHDYPWDEDVEAFVAPEEWTNKGFFAKGPDLAKINEAVKNQQPVPPPPEDEDEDEDEDEE